MTRVVLLMACVIAGCAGGGAKRESESTAPVRVRMETSKGDIVLELDSQHAPVTVANFLKYLDRGDYNGTIFHRVKKDFVIQGGGWTPDLMDRAKKDAAAGNPDVPIKNEWRNGLKNTRGTIAMARDEQPDTAMREFYINLVDNARLDTARPTTGNAGYAVFGRVVEGMGVVDAIGLVPTREVNVPGITDGSMGNVPLEPIMIRRVHRE